ncbi:MAG: D-alanyl-D-alanine carboxypeptidase, partial [Sutterella sp.]
MRGKSTVAGTLLAAGALLLTGAPSGAGEPDLPPVLKKAAARWKVDPEDVTVSLTALEGTGVIGKDGLPAGAKPVFAWHADRLSAPASTAKLVTTLAGLELLGGAWRWSTGIYADVRPDAKGRVEALYIRGGGDPTLVVEKFALLLDRLAQLGLRHIAGDIIVDRSYFDIPKGDPAAFDGRKNRPYNQLPDAALVNWRNLSFDFVPDPASGRARIVTVPKLAGVRVPASVPLRKKGGCGDWKTAIGYRLTAAADGTKSVKFDGAFPAACGEKNFNVIALPADEYLERLIRALWVKEGRTWKG